MAGARKKGPGLPVDAGSEGISGNPENKANNVGENVSAADGVVSMATMFSKALDIFDDVIVGMTKDFKISVWSKGAEKKLGYEKSEVIGKDVRILVPEDRLNELESEIRTIREGRIIEGFETLRIDRNGRLIDVSIYLAPLYDSGGVFSGAIGIYKDISEKKELARKLHEHEKRCRYALEGGQFGVWDLDIVRQKVFCFNFWEKTLGYEENELDNSFDTWKFLIHPDDLPEMTRKFRRHLEGEEYVAEFRIRCKNGEYKWIRTKGRIIEWGEDGRPLRMVGTNEDITKEKIMQQELEEKCRQLEILKREAERANEAKSRFLANMSHEIRTPMNGVITTLQLLQSSNLTEEQRKYVKLLKNSADSLVSIINNVLDITKLESGKIELNNEPFNLKETLGNIYENLLIAANSKGLEAGCYLDPKIDYEVIGDELKLGQILTNLTSNAVKFTDNGYVALRAKLVSSDSDSQKIEFSVKDTGIGIDDSFKPKIFENFSQGDLSGKKKYMGTGLGLAISKQLAELMNGSIHFESAVGQGSTFYFTCDFKRQKSAAEAFAPNGKNNSAEQKKGSSQYKKDKVILCVEDNLINQEVMESIILKGGYRYVAAYDGREAMEKLKNGRIDLVLMDIQIPELNGYEITKMIRSMEGDVKNIPIIAVTAYAMHEDRDKCIQAGMDDYISKPLDIEKLYNIIDAHLGI